MFGRTWLACLTAAALLGCAAAPSVDPQVRSELAASGKLRAAINYGNPALARKDAASGELSGVAVELSRALSRGLGVPVELVGYEAVAKLLTGFKAGEWDVAFLAIDPARAGELTFTAPYMEVEVTYLVPDASPVRHVTQADRPGMRIALQERNAADLFLSRELKHATVVRAPTSAAGLALLKAGSADALAENRQSLYAQVAANPGYRIVEGRFATIPQALAVPRGRSAAAAYLEVFVAEARASGLVQRAIETHGVRGVVVAGAAASTQPTADERASLAPTGKLRIGVYPGSPTSMVRDAATGEVKGVTVDLGAELARRLDVPVERVEFRTAGEVVDGIKSGRVDFAVTNGTPARALIADFTPPVLAIESGYLVPAGSAIRSFAELDKPGVRIGVLQGSTSLSVLPGRMPNAAIIPMPSLQAAIDMLASGKLDAYATNKAVLFEMSDALPGSRVLEGRWGMEEIAIGIPKGRAAGLDYARRFAADAMAQGLVAQAAKRAGLRGIAQ